MLLSDAHTHYPEKTQASICFASSVFCENFSLEEQLLASCKIIEKMPFSFGIHPWQASKVSYDFEKQLNSLEVFFTNRPKNAFLGEIGLDLCKGNIESQLYIFERQLQIAINTACPLVLIHCVKATHLLFSKLASFRKKNKKTIFIIHSFCGSSQEALKLLEYDVYFSFSFKLLFASKKTALALKSLPLSRILTETDLAESSTLLDTLNLISKIKQISLEKISAIVFNNAQNILSCL